MFVITHFEMKENLAAQMQNFIKNSVSSRKRISMECIATRASEETPNAAVFPVEACDHIVKINV